MNFPVSKGLLDELFKAHPILIVTSLFVIFSFYIIMDMKNVKDLIRENSRSLSSVDQKQIFINKEDIVLIKNDIKDIKTSKNDLVNKLSVDIAVFQETLKYIRSEIGVQKNDVDEIQEEIDLMMQKIAIIHDSVTQVSTKKKPKN